jgi:hypothetical protein
MPLIRLPKNEDSIVKTLVFLMMLKMTALAVDCLYLEIPKVQKGKWNSGLSSEKINGSILHSMLSILQL